MNTQTTNSITVTIPNPTVKQLSAIVAILDPTKDTTKVMTDGSLAALTTKGKRGSSKKGTPLKTLADDTDEEFAKSEMEEDDEDLEDEEDEESDEDEEDEEQGKLDFDTVVDAIDTYGEKKPKDMKAILASFGFKSVQELKRSKGQWLPVWTKVKAKMKAAKIK